MQPAYKRILLKLSGEVLAGKEGHGINFDTVSDVCKHCLLYTSDAADE